MKTKFYIYIVVFLFSFILYSCEKEKEIIPQSAAGFTASTLQATVGEEIQFTNVSENATAYLWSFGDGTTSKEVSPKKAYQTSNNFLVSLVSTGVGGTTISSMEIVITPASSFTVENEDDLAALTAVQFTNTSEEGSSYLWSFGDADNSTSTDENPIFIFPSEGTYTVSLTASSEYGNHIFSKEVSIGAAPLNIYNLFYIALGDEFIRNLVLDGTGFVNNVLDIAGKGGVGMAYDEVNDKIYFSDFEDYTTPNGQIWRMNTDGTELESIASGINDPYGIALDLVAGKIYWVDNDGNVSRANLDGTASEIVLTLAGTNLRAISLDVENSKMYFYDANIEDLYVANMDGTNPSIIISGIYGYAILVDTVNDKIYFDDQNDDLLKMANLDGSGIQTVDDNGTRIYGMDIDYEAGKLYWSGRDSGEIYRSNLDGSDREVLKTGIASPRGLFLLK